MQRPQKTVEQILKYVYETQSIQKKRKEIIPVSSPFKKPLNSGPIRSELVSSSENTLMDRHVSCSMGDNRFRVVGKIPIVTNILHGCHVVKALCVRSLKTVMPFSATHWTQHALEMALLQICPNKCMLMN